MPNIRIVSKEAIQAERRQRGHVVPHATLNEPMTRLATSQQGIEAIRNKVILDVNEGREEIPTLYEAIYNALRSDTLPRTIDLNIISNAQAVFFERLEGEEVRFGTLAAGTPGSVTLRNWSTGFEWTREMEMFNEEYRVELWNQEFGRSYNALLNHLHLSPILTHAYAAANKTAADTTGATLLDKTRNTVVNGLRAAATAKRPASVLLASSSDKYTLQDALARRFDSVGNELPAIEGVDTIIYYDGEDDLTVGEKTYSYAGVTAKKAYLIRPKRQFRELVRTQDGQDLIIDMGNPDVSRGILDQIIAHTYRTIYAAVAGNVQELTLP
jgi:hypothetical protein